MKKNILLLDTNFSAKPIYDYLLQKNNTVFVMGNRPDDFLAKISNNYINQDYADVDELKKIIAKLKIDFLVPGGNDFSYKICSIINKKTQFYNIDSEEINDIINDKEKFRKFALENNLHVPRFVDENNVHDYLPIIVKPVDAYSGHGMTVVNNVNSTKLADAISHARCYSKKDKYIIEEFVKGELYSHSAFISDGRIICDFIVKEFCTTNKYVVDISFADNHFPEKILRNLRKDIKTIIEKLDLHNGLIHTQFIINGDDFWLIEITRRIPGDLYSQLIEFSTGFPYAEYYAKPFLNIKNENYSQPKEINNILRHTISLKEKDVFQFLEITDPLTIKKFFPLVMPGDVVEKSPFGRIGLLFVKFESFHELLNIIPAFESKEIYSIN